MQKYYHADIYKLVYEEEFFATKTAMIEYLKDNWDDYAYPIGDEFKLISVLEDEDSLNITITYETLDYDAEEDGSANWNRDTHSVEFTRVQLTHLTSEL